MTLLIKQRTLASTMASWFVYIRVVVVIFLDVSVFHLPNNYVGSVSLRVVEEQSLWEWKDGKKPIFYRIPLLVNTPNGDVLAFIEERTTTKDIDVGSKSIIMRRSSDQGATWSDPVNIIKKAKNVSDQYNLGTVIVDKENGSLILLIGQCTLWTCGSITPSVLMMRSYNWGYNWTTPTSLSQHNANFTNFSFFPGPGVGVQKQYPPHRGRLISCGRSQGRHSLRMAMQCIVSDDHGDTWKLAGRLQSIPFNQPHVDNDFGISAPQLLESPNGSLMVNSRNDFHFNCNCRITSRSLDGADTFPWDTVLVDKSLPDPACQGSTLLFDNITLFSNPADLKKRINMEVKWSTDFGEKWAGNLLISHADSAYSCLANVDKSHIGLLYEAEKYKKVSFVKIKIK